FFSSRRRHTSFSRDWSSDVCSSDLWGVTELPVFDPNDRHNFGSFWMNGLTARAFEDPAKLEASLKFLRFITSEEAMKLWLEQVGELPARLSLADDPELAEDPVYGPFIRSLPHPHATSFVHEEGQRRQREG